MKLKIKDKDISSIVGNITLNSAIDTLGDQLDFEITYSDMKFYPKFEVNVGDIVQLEDQGVVFIGIVVTKTRNENTQTFNCFDFAFYLNKSKTVKQFNGMRADMAIKSLLEEFNVPVGKIDTMPTVIKSIYFDQEVSEIIKDILEQVKKTTGKKYVMEMNKDKLDIYQDENRIVDCKIQMAQNLPKVPVGQTISGASKKATIENMKNVIKLYIGNDEKMRIVADERNSNLVSRYGMLSETQSFEGKDIVQARNIARNMLKELGRVAVESSIDVLGNFELKAGRVLQVNEPKTNLAGKFRIKSANHQIGDVHTTSLELEEI
ncbi:MAG: hypothetical protein ACK5MV_10540 [Aminipila sp.]